MDEKLMDNEHLIARIQQLEQERDELRKDIEQLCMQQSGPSYLAVATRMHFQRIAGLEEEIENMRSKLATFSRENSNLQEELSEAYCIKGQLAELHNTELAKNMEIEKQLKFFQGCVAAAFSERDHSIIEAEKAKEKEELLSKKLNDLEQRVERLATDNHEEKKLTAKLQIDLERHETLNEMFKRVVEKFYEIRQNSLEIFGDTSYEDKCECLLNDSAEMWSFSHDEETSSSKYISALEDEVETLRKSVDNLQNKLRVGLEIETHLKKKVFDLEKKKILPEEKIMMGISKLHNYQSQLRIDIMNLVDEGYSHFKSTSAALEEKIGQVEKSKEENPESPQVNLEFEKSKCQDEHARNDNGLDFIAENNNPGVPPAITIETRDASEALTRALQEKVDALLLLSQQEECHLLEGNVNAALQKKLEELQRNLLQVTNEKVKALMELAQLKQEYQLFQEKVGLELKQQKIMSDSEEKRIVHDGDGRLKKLLKKTYIRHWIGGHDSAGNEAQFHLNHGGSITNSRSGCNMDFARMKIENATLKEGLESMQHLITSVHRLHLQLLKVKGSVTLDGTAVSISEALDDIITDAKLVKTALGSSLPPSWSTEDEMGSGSSGEKADVVTAAGFEMVDLLVLAAQILKVDILKKSYSDVGKQGGLEDESSVLLV